ncbi:hypothetical protein [Neorhizobium sp. DAR64872/K0K18]|uniref:hypothetical protein n=1 Tax=Neorhizobium sp. DAR64872/K0K18 TaxID=3421958 RepID=UPI003D2CF056
MRHPVELSLEQQLEDLMDDLDGPALGVARKVLVDDCDLSDLSVKQLRVWSGLVIPAMRRQSENRDARWRKELMDRED